jgi:regulator of replication initiation timing
MNSEQTLISGIEHKVRKLIEHNLSLRQENADLKSSLEKINEENINLSGELSTKKGEIINYTIANTLELELGEEEGKRKIDNLIEEIDKCIAVLSD